MKTLVMVYTGTCKCWLGWEDRQISESLATHPLVLCINVCAMEKLCISIFACYFWLYIYTMVKAKIMHRSPMYCTNIDKSLFHFKLNWTLYQYKPLSSVTMVTLSTTVTLSTAGPVSRFIKLTMWCQPVISTNNSIQV